MVYRAFLEPGLHGWPDQACVGCSMVADQDATRPPERPEHHAGLRLPRPEATSGRQGSYGLEDAWSTMKDGIDVDFGVDQWHGTNAYTRDGDRVFRSYFINSPAPRRPGPRGATWT